MLKMFAIAISKYETLEVVKNDGHNCLSLFDTFEKAESVRVKINNADKYKVIDIELITLEGGVPPLHDVLDYKAIKSKCEDVANEKVDLMYPDKNKYESEREAARYRIFNQEYMARVS